MKGLGTNSKGYKLQGKTNVQGLAVAIENRKGSVREGKTAAAPSRIVREEILRRLGASGYVARRAAEGGKEGIRGYRSALRQTPRPEVPLPVRLKSFKEWKETGKLPGLRLGWSGAKKDVKAVKGISRSSPKGTYEHSPELVEVFSGGKRSDLQAALTNPRSRFDVDFVLPGQTHAATHGLFAGPEELARKFVAHGSRQSGGVQKAEGALLKAQVPKKYVVGTKRHPGEIYLIPEAVESLKSVTIKAAEAKTAGTDDTDKTTKGFYRGAPASPHTVKFKTDFQGIPINVDRPKGFIMKGTDARGNDWARRYKFDYGFIPKTLGGDGDGLDVFIGPNKKAPEAFWAVQRKEDGSFDEYKVFLGFENRDEAIVAYRQHIPKKFFKGIMALRVEMMKSMLGRVNPDEQMKRASALAMADELGWLMRTSA